MRLASKSIAVSATLLVSCMTSDAWAQAAGAQLTQGWVTGVHRANGQLGFRVRTGGMNQQAALGANRNAAVVAAQNTRMFLVGPATRFEAAQGMNLMPASFAALRSGQRVLIESQGAQATRVRIFPRRAYVGRAGRGRSIGHVSHARRVTQTAPLPTSRAATAIPAAQSTKNHPPHQHVVALHGRSGKR